MEPPKEITNILDLSFFVFVAIFLILGKKISLLIKFILTLFAEIGKYEYCTMQHEHEMKLVSGAR